MKRLLQAGNHNPSLNTQLDVSFSKIGTVHYQIRELKWQSLNLLTKTIRSMNELIHNYIKINKQKQFDKVKFPIALYRTRSLYTNRITSDRVRWAVLASYHRIPNDLDIITIPVVFVIFLSFSIQINMIHRSFLESICCYRFVS